MVILDRFSLQEQVVIVTGGAGLYGQHFSRALAEAGAHVVITSRNLSDADAAARALSRDGLSASGAQLDLADPGGISRFASEMIREHGAIDVLVNNAVHRAGGGLSDTSAEDWDATSAVNSRGLFLISQAVGGEMARRGSGSIVNIGSIYGLVGPDFRIYEGTAMTMPAFYAFDKAGMVGFTRYLAAALGSSGVRVNCLCPGGLRTDDQDSSFTRAYEARVPLGRMAGAHDATGPLVFLASEASAYVTGIALAVDGGWSAT